MSCVNTCIAVAVPGPPASPCDPCTDGNNGEDAISTIVDAFNMPAQGGDTASLEVSSSLWMVPGAVMYAQNAGNMGIVSKADGTHVVLRNLRDDSTDAYADNADAGTAIAPGQLIAPSGPQGPRGLSDVGVLVGYGLLGQLTAVNLNSAATDNLLSIGSARYLIDRVTLESPTQAVTTATMGLFTAAAAGGVTLCADQALSGTLTAASKIMNLTKQAVVNTDRRTETTLYARVGTAEGSTRTVNLKLYGWIFDT